MTLGKRFRQLRRAHDLTQKDVARQLHVGQQQISFWENDIGRIPARLIPAIVVLFHLPNTDAFFVGTDCLYENVTTSRDTKDKIYG